MKKIIKFFIVFIFSNILLINPSFASNKLHVRALEDFSSLNPNKYFSVEVINDGEIGDLKILKGDVINCTLEKIKNPTRAKQDAKIFLKLNNYEDKLGIHQFPTPLKAKYSKSAVNKEEIKKIPPKKVVIKTASTVGSHFIPGLSYGVSFVDGFVENEENNRLKSAVKQVYDDSFISLVEKGSQVEIEAGDEFYLVVKKAKD